MIKKIVLLNLVIFFLMTGCSKPNKVVVTSHKNEDIVSEITTISCDPFEESEISKIKLFIDGLDKNVIDDSAPWSLKWNTTDYEDNSEHTLNILAFDSDGDSTFSDTLTLIVDNSKSYPKKVEISSIELKKKGFNLKWTKSQDNDFSKYILEKSSKKSMSDAEVIFESNIITDTQFRDTKVNPLKFQYYRLSVEDYVGYKTIGDIFSSDLEKVPSSINIKSVEYDTNSMTISWERSSEVDFSYYSLYRANSIEGKKKRISKISSKNKTSYSVIEFNPLIENWFWIEVTDIHGYKTIGPGKKNIIDLPPSPTDITEINYNDEVLTLSFNQNLDIDFKSYELLLSNQNVNNISLGVIKDQIINSIQLTDFDPTIINNYKIITTDIWGQTSVGKTAMNKIDKVPNQVTIKSLKFNGTSLEFEWTKSDENNFDKYYVCHTYDLGVQPDTVAIFDNQDIVSYKLNSGFNPNIDNWVWIIVSDSRNQSSISAPQVLKNNPPKKSELYLELNQDNDLFVNWNKNQEDDFKKYILFHSHNPDMKDSNILFESSNQSEIDYKFSIVDHSRINYFQLVVEDVFGEKTESEFVSGVPTDLQVLLDIVIENNLNIIPSELGTQIWENGRLTELSIGDWSDGGGIKIYTLPQSIGGLSELKSLWLSYNNLNEIPDSFSNLSNLEILELRSNNLEKVTKSLVDLKNLKYLGLSYNNITKLPDWVKDFSSLTKLFLSHNKLSGLPESICEINLNYKEMGDSFIAQNELCYTYDVPECVQSYHNRRDQKCLGN